MCVLDGIADFTEQSQPFANRELYLVAVLGQWNAVDQFHHKIRHPVFGLAAVVDRRDVLMTHHRQSLPFGFETSDDLFVRRTGFDQFQSHTTPHGPRLLGHPDFTHSARAQLLQQFVGADDARGGRSRQLRRARTGCLIEGVVQRGFKFRLIVGRLAR